MFSRIRDGLVYPKLLVQYRKDKIWKALLFILFFGVLLATRSIVNVITFDGGVDYFEYIDESAIDDSDTSCVIANSVLSCSTNESKLIYNDTLFYFYIDSSDLNLDDYGGFGYTIVFNEDMYYVVFSGIVLIEDKISTLPSEFHNLDIDYSDHFYEQLFSGTDQVITDSKAYWGTSIILVEVILNTLLFLFFVLINSSFLRRRFKVVPFKELFVMSTYASTALFIVMAFNSLINFSFIIVIVLIIFAFRQTNSLAVEIDTILKKQTDNKD